MVAGADCGIGCLGPGAIAQSLATFKGGDLRFEVLIVLVVAKGSSATNS